MNEVTLRIRAFQPVDEAEVVQLWQRCGLVRPWNDPHRDVARKLKVQAEWFLVAEQMTAQGGSALVASVMAGYDGHRGWVNYLAVDPDRQREGLATRMMAEVERRLQDAGCPKINLQVRVDNEHAKAFYEAAGYTRDEVVSYGKRLIPDDSPGQDQQP